MIAGSEKLMTGHMCEWYLYRSVNRWDLSRKLFADRLAFRHARCTKPSLPAR